MRSSEAPVLDELFILDTRGEESTNPNLLHNGDVMGTTTMQELFQNDYWGKNIFQMDSHKSWRPVCVLTFRIFNSLSESKGIFRGLEDILPISTMFTHRLVNVIIHTLLSDVVARAGLIIFPTTSTSYHSTIQFTLTKLFFALHPTHIEAVANAANRNHILAVLASTYCSFGMHTNIAVVIIATIGGLLSSEAFVFQLPAIIVTIALVWFRKNKFKLSRNRQTLEAMMKSALKEFIPQILPPIFFTFLYLILRYKYDTLSILEALIRNAENPFYRFTGTHRVINYCYVFAVHVFKGVGFDPIGFSHEYGFNCVPEIESISDSRLFFPLFIYGFLIICFEIGMRRSFYGDHEFSLKFIFGLSWMSTLFPITGIIRVGTFIAYRMIVPFTFGVAILAGNIATDWLLPPKMSRYPVEVLKKDKKLRGRLAQVFLMLALMSIKLKQRTENWMSSVNLLESSLKTCPRYAKVNLELSKVYSGTVAGNLDLEKSLEYAVTAEEIDPNYCLVNYQFALVYFQQNEYTLFEERLIKAMLCMPTIEKAHKIWTQYWPIVTDPMAGPSAVQASQRLQEAEELIRRAMYDGGSVEEPPESNRRPATEADLEFEL